MDGKRVDTRGTRPNSDNAGIEQGWLPPMEAIERIEVVRGPMSSLYGSDAMGGVINVITRKTSRTEWKGSLHGDATLQENRDSGDLFQTNAYASGPLIEGLLGVRVNGLPSRRAEDKIVNGYNEQRMRSGTAVFTLTPDEKNEFDFEIGRSLQDRNSTPGKSVVAERCSKGKCTPNVAQRKPVYAHQLRADPQRLLRLRQLNQLRSAGRDQQPRSQYEDVQHHLQHPEPVRAGLAYAEPRRPVSL